MLTIKEALELNAELLKLPARVRDMYLTIGLLVHKLDPDAGAGSLQPIHIKVSRGISDDDALALTNVYDNPAHHYMFLRAYSLDCVGDDMFESSTWGDNPPTPHYLIDLLANKLPNFNTDAALLTLAK